MTISVLEFFGIATRSATMTATMSEFAAQLNVSTTYLRKVCRELEIVAKPDPLCKSRRLLSEAQQAEIAEKMGRSLSATSTATNSATDEPIDAELVLSPVIDADYTPGLAVAAEIERDNMLAEARINNQYEALLNRVDAFGYEIGNRVAKSITNGINSGLSRGLHNGAAQVPGGK